jgi:nitroimidazol reductase NimA-like FMN-containing flavoprotein (pyridoxamine 5'-phosphate oxidase superfamily)
MLEPILRELSRGDCLGLLGSAAVGRVGISIDAMPAVLPVNFALHEQTIVFRSGPGTKLSAATCGAVVAFEADGYDAEGHTGWSVMVRGVAHEITDAALLEQVRTLPLDSWALGDHADHFVSIETTLVTGRRFDR